MNHCILSTLLLFSSLLSVTATPTVVSRNGAPALPVVHAPDAQEPVVQAAYELAAILEQMTGAGFDVLPSTEPKGIVVGTVADFPTAPGSEKLKSENLLEQENYIIRTDGERVWLIGASVAGANHAVWDFLHRVGYRQYFPGPDWEIIPKAGDINADFDVFSSPDYHVRRFAWHFGNWPELREETLQWTVRNRLSNRPDLPGTFTLSTGHIYGAIINANREEIDAHPGICSIVNGRPTSKLNPANPRTIEMVEQFASDYFEKNPENTSISMDPSDGGGWGTSPEELAIGTPSDRAVYLANRVAEFINKKFGQKYVGIYSYNEHSPAPEKVRVHPNVIVSIATAFIQGGFTVEELMSAWRAAGSEMLGIREYHSVVAWDLARPTGGRASSLSYLSKTIPEFHGLGARFYTTEAGENWGPQGLGNYFTARALWDVEEAAKSDAILKEFVANCFPEAQEPMLRLYQEILHPQNSRILSEDLLARMFRALDEAKRSTTDPAALRRIDALILYARYSELLLAYQNSRSGNSTAEAQHEAAVELIRFAYRTRDNRMVSTLALFRDLPRRNTAVQRPEEADWKVSEEKNPWKESTPVAREEIDAILAAGVANNEPLDFEPVAFSTDLVPAANLPAVARSLEIKPPRAFGMTMRGVNRFHTWSDGGGDAIRFNATPGVVYQNRGDVTFSLYSRGAVDTGQDVGEQEDGTVDVPVDLTPVDTAVFPPDRTQHAVALKADGPGGYFVETRDSMGGFRITDWEVDRTFTLESSEESVYNTNGRSDLVFYVPRGTKTLGVFTRGVGTIYDASNRPVHEMKGETHHVSIPVPEGMDGAFWRFYGMVGGRVQLLTVPPFMAPSARQLLLPREVVEADGGMSTPQPNPTNP